MHGPDLRTGSRAMTLGVPNSRMKDFYDIWMLFRAFDFRGGRGTGRGG